MSTRSSSGSSSAVESKRVPTFPGASVIMGIICVALLAALWYTLTPAHAEDKFAPDAACCGSAPKATGGPDAFGYRFIDHNSATGPKRNFIDISATGTSLGFAPEADEIAMTLNLNDAFSFYGSLFVSLRVSVNGYISTLGTDVGADYVNDCPLPQVPNPPVGGARIYPLHDDLKLRTDGQVYAQFFQKGPVRNLSGVKEPSTIIMWSHASWFSDANVDQDIECILFHKTGEIRYQYRGLDVDGFSQTIGIQNDGASTGLTYMCNTAGGVTDDTVVALYDKRIRTTFPNGGEKFRKGQNYNISWNSQGQIGKVSIILLRGKDNVLTIANKTKNDGSFNWQVPFNLQNGTNYRILVRSKKVKEVQDKSDGKFEIALI